MIAVWCEPTRLRQKLLVLLQAGLTYADAGEAASERLRQQWVAYYRACTQGAGGRILQEGQPPHKIDSGTETVRTGDAPPTKRLRGKTTVPMAPEHSAGTRTSQSEPPLQGDEYLLHLWDAKDGNPDPRAVVDAKVASLIRAHLRPNPLLPIWLEEDMADIGYDASDFYCSFQNCNFETDCLKTFETHLQNMHGKVLTFETSAGNKKGQCVLAYRRLLTAACHKGAPCAHRLIDRRCLRRYRQALGGDRVGAGICFVCARRFPYSQGMEGKDDIEWKYLLSRAANDLLGLQLEDARALLGYDAYWCKYGSQHGEEVQARLREDLRDWSAVVHAKAGNFEIVCCPEDKRCPKRCPRNHVCAACSAPVCHSCWGTLVHQNQLPPEALMNELLIFYPPKQIYEQDVTFMELVCASPCFTSMTCFSLEKKRLADRALDQDAFMPRNRLVARGNATTFPLPWEDLEQKLKAATLKAQAGQLQLPKIGQELAETINVIIKAGAWDSGLADPAKIIHQARVRRSVVLELLRAAKERGHPAYATVNLDAAAARAQKLPEDGVPPEIVALLPHDNDLDDVQRQKAATPVREYLSVEEVHAEFAAMCKPNAVVNERTSAGFGDENAQQVSALCDLASGKTHGERSFILHTGNRLLDQFEPWYFAFAFPFLFPYGTGMPDPPKWSDKTRHRRKDDSPRLELSAWMRCLSRRCEAQVNRDWIFGFALWNLYFRSKINLAPRSQIYDTDVYDEKRHIFRRLQSQDIEDGALQLVNALGGSYTDAKGNLRPIKGDISKLAYVPGLRPGARKLMQHLKQISTELPGTQEARKQMRHEIKAMRIRYGVPIFVTVSPDEAHQWLFIRMSRTRESDPVRRASPWQEWTCGDREFPPSDGDVTFPVHVERFCRALPSWQQRRALLARDPLASVDGFRTLLQLLLQHLFGLNFCSRCPD